MRVSSTASPLRILLVEDSSGDAILIEKALIQAMHNACIIQKAATLDQALKILAKGEFDVALLDRSLPDVAGYDGLHSLQNMAPKLPIVFLTAYKDEEIALETIEQGAQDYLFKDKMDGHTIQRSIQFAVIRKHFESVLLMQANFDTLTGMANRMLFENRLDMGLARMKRHSGNLSVLFLDLNRFKQVNDQHGHAVGDKLLAEIGRRIQQCLRPYDTAARFGGDEFAVLIEGMADRDQCTTIAQKIIRLCDMPFTYSNIDMNVGVSIGIAGCSANEPIGRQEIMRRADVAMYAAKSLTNSAYRFASDLPAISQQFVA